MSTDPKTEPPAAAGVPPTADTATTPSAAPTDSPAPPFSSHPTSLTDAQADSLAEALTTTTPHSDIAARHNLTVPQLSMLAKSPLLADKIAAISALHALHDTAIIREQISKLRDIANTTDSPIEARRASTTIIRHSAIMARIAAGHNKRAPASLRTNKPLPDEAGSPTVREGDGPAPGPCLPSDTYLTPSSAASSFALSPIPRRPIPPPAPKPYSTPELLFAHQLQQLRTHQPKNSTQAFNALYDYLDHPIKCFANLQPKLKARIDASTILQHYNAHYEDLGPPTMDQEVVTPAPVSPDLSLKPILKHFAIKRYAFAREGTTPLYLRVHLAKQDPLIGETTDRWALSDLAIDSS